MEARLPFFLWLLIKFYMCVVFILNAVSRGGYMQSSNRNSWIFLVVMLGFLFVSAPEELLQVILHPLQTISAEYEYNRLHGGMRY